MNEAQRAEQLPYRKSHVSTGEAKKFAWWHEAIIDYMFMNPQSTKKEMAAHFRMTYQGLEYILSSDLFRFRYQERRDQINQAIRDEILERSGRVAAKGLKIIEEHFDHESGEKEGPKPARLKTPLLSINEVTNKLLSSLGYGPQKAGVTIVNQQNGVVEVGATKTAIEEARAKIRREQTEQIRSTAEEAQVIEESFLEPELPLFNEERGTESSPTRESSPLPELLDFDPLADFDGEEIELVAGGEAKALSVTGGGEG